jgi:hypothetical protein
MSETGKDTQPIDEIAAPRARLDRIRPDTWNASASRVQ